MLLWILNQLNSLISADWTGVTAMWEKITPRAALAAGMSFTIALLLGPRCIQWLQARFREPIKSDSAELERLHRTKQSTPTMGGLFIIAALAAGVLLFTDLHNAYVLPAVCLVFGMMLIGIVDDLVKLRSPQKGISARQKITAQIVVASMVTVLLYREQAALADGLLLHVPGLEYSISLGIWFVPIGILVIVGASNAVNLTDGLDGLAGGCLLTATAAMTVLVYAAGHAQWAAYLGIPHIPQAGEMTVAAAAMIGSVLGFLWFNCHPAQVFMGDTGALPLGALLGFLAIVARQEIVLIPIAGVFVVEALSVMLQVAWFKWRGTRLFRCAPLHHHFQFLGWPENKIVVRFWIAAALCALAGVSSLRLGAGDSLEHASNTSISAAQRVSSHPAPSDNLTVNSTLPRGERLAIILGGSVILSKAKNPPDFGEILRCAQNDRLPGISVKPGKEKGGF